MILRSVKGSVVVLMNTTDYFSKMKSILRDHMRLKLDIGDKHLTKSTEKRITNVFRDLLKMIDNSAYSCLWPRGPYLPHMYDLSKIHKQDIPLRSMLSIVNSPYHIAARWLADNLKPDHQRLATQTWKDPFEFVDSMDHINIAGKFMASFDVTLLFTKISLFETIDIIFRYSDFLTPPA